MFLLSEFGAIFIYRHEMKKTEFETTRDETSETDLKASASLMSQYAQASFSAGKKDEKTKKEKANELSSKVTTYTISKELSMSIDGKV